jgi:trimethylamine--corrinoid protein Co-methyltransferase
MAHFRDFWYPDLLSREIRETWQERGGTRLGERLTEKVKTIIEDHRPEPLATHKQEKVEKILEQARA